MRRSNEPVNKTLFTNSTLSTAPSEQAYVVVFAKLYEASPQVLDAPYTDDNSPFFAMFGAI